MNFSKKYQYLGDVFLYIPEPWKPIVKEAIIKIDKSVYPLYIPRFIRRLLSKLARNHSIIRLKSRFWYNIEKFITKEISISQIKDKFGGLRIYMTRYTKEIEKIIQEAEEKCSNTCEKCGSHNDVQLTNRSWIYNYCKECRK